MQILWRETENGYKEKGKKPLNTKCIYVEEPKDDKCFGKLFHILFRDFQQNLNLALYIFNAFYQVQVSQIFALIGVLFF